MNTSSTEHIYIYITNEQHVIRVSAIARTYTLDNLDTYIYIINIAIYMWCITTAVEESRS